MGVRGMCATSGGGFALMTEAIGLAGMRERVEILGGTFAVHSAHGQGTVVHASLPLAAPELEHG